MFQIVHILFQPKKQEKKKGASTTSGNHDIFNAHDFDIDINVAEMGVCFYNMINCNVCMTKHFRTQ